MLFVSCGQYDACPTGRISQSCCLCRVDSMILARGLPARLHTIVVLFVSCVFCMTRVRGLPDKLVP